MSSVGSNPTPPLALLLKVVQGYKTYRFSELTQISVFEMKVSLTNINEM